MMQSRPPGRKCLFLLMLLVFHSCKKDYNANLHSAAISNTSLEFTDTVRVPINDLGTGTYMGVMGGLYPGGSNQPSGQLSTMSGILSGSSVIASTGIDLRFFLILLRD